MAKLNKVRTKDRKFTCVFNEVIQDKSLSWKARGIFIYLWSLPDNWSFSEMEVMTHSIDGRSSLRSGLQELEKHNYLKRNSPRNNGHIQAGESQWILSDKQMSENQTSNNKMSDKQMSENQTLQNNYPTKYLFGQSNKITNTNDDKPNYRQMIVKDLESLMVNINTFVSQDIDDWLDNYDPKLIMKAIHQVGSTSPSPAWVVKDISTQLARGCQTYQPKRHFNRRPVNSQQAEHSKQQLQKMETPQKFHPTPKKQQEKVQRMLKRLNKNRKK